MHRYVIIEQNISFWMGNIAYLVRYIIILKNLHSTNYHCQNYQQCKRLITQAPAGQFNSVNIIEQSTGSQIHPSCDSRWEQQHEWHLNNGINTQKAVQHFPLELLRKSFVRNNHLFTHLFLRNLEQYLLEYER